MSATLKLEKILKFCEQRNFFSVVRSRSLIHHVNYGPLGAQLQNQILKEWNRTIFNDAETTIFPVTCPVFHLSQIRPSLLSGMIQQYLPALQLVGGRLPFGLAQNGTCFQKSNLMENLEEGIFQPHIWKPEEFQSLTIVFFCSPKSSCDWLRFWCKRRLSWWKKFSGFLSDFSATEISESEPGCQSAELRYKAPWGDFQLEKIFDLGSKPLEDLSKVTKQTDVAPDGDGQTVDLPHVIVCETNLDSAVLTYLLDAYEEKEKSIVLRLHRKLAPYKAAVALATSSSDMTKLRDLARHILEDLGEVGIPVFPSPHSPASLDSQITRFDELGLPYSVILNEGTLKNGIVGLRHRDTTRKEQVHVSDIKATLLRNLQIEQQSI